MRGLRHILIVLFLISYRGLSAQEFDLYDFRYYKRFDTVEELLAPEADSVVVFVKTSAGYQEIISPKLLEFTAQFDSKTLFFTHIHTFYCNKNTKFVENFAQFMNLSYICGLIA